MRVEVRRAFPSEAEVLALVETKTHSNDSSITQPQRFRVESYKKLLNGDADVFVLAANGKVTAVCVVLPCGDENYPNYADIVEILVLPEAQNNSYAKKLISYALDEARKKGFANVCARYLSGAKDCSEERAVRLFKSLGFKTWCSKPDCGGIYEVVFTKELV